MSAATALQVSVKELSPVKKGKEKKNLYDSMIIFIFLKMVSN